MNIDTKQLVDQIADAGLDVPEHTASSLIRYLFDGLPPEGFVESVLRNDLMRAAQSADYANKERLGYIAEFIMYYVPGEARGNNEKISAWCFADSTHRMSFRTKMAEETIKGTPILEALYNYACSHSYS